MADEVEEKKETEELAEEKPVSQKNRSGHGVSNSTIQFKKDFEIYSNNPVPQYDTGICKAYSAMQTGRASKELVAIVVERHLAPRIENISRYLKISSPNLAQLIDYGVVFWPPAKGERFVLLYNNNFGNVYLETNKEAALGWRPEDITDIVAKPMVAILKDFKERAFNHGSINPMNMYGTTSGHLKKFVLGDGLSSPCSSQQPAMYLPIERMMADPIGRGEGEFADDSYAFGVSLVVMMRSHDPLKGLSDEQILKKKIELGTYTALAGRDRFKGAELEIMRGLLHDDPAQRWGLEELMTWADGRRLSPKQGIVRKKASRPFVFADNKHSTVISLSTDIHKNPADLKRVVDDDSLLQWVERSVNDDLILERLQDIIQIVRDAGTGAGYTDRLVAGVSVAIDGNAPFKYKGISIFPNGYGTSLAHAYINKRDLKPYADMAGTTIIPLWLNNHLNPNVDVASMFSKYDQIRRYIKSSRIGEGLERCMYSMSSDVPCLSEGLTNYLVFRPRDLLLAYEDMCESSQAPTLLIDRHVAAFLMEKDSKVIESCLYDVNSGNKAKVILANLRCMSYIQARNNIRSVPKLSSWFAKKLDSVYELYHDRKVREKLKKAINDMAGNGDLVKMEALLDNHDILSKDVKGFKAAKAEFHVLSREEMELNELLKDKEKFGLESAQEWIAMASAILSVLIVIGALFVLLGQVFS